MNEDFEEIEDYEFEDFEDAFSELEDDGFNMEEVQTRTTILSKNNLIALLCIKTAQQGGAICRVDPREEKPAVQIYDDPQKALDWFTKSLDTSCKNGWQIVYDGLPLRG